MTRKERRQQKELLRIRQEVKAAKEVFKTGDRTTAYKMFMEVMGWDWEPYITFDQFCEAGQVNMLDPNW